MSTTESLSDQKREQILGGAARVFSEDGYEGASMARIAAVAGVSKGTLYNHFDSKAALFTAYIASQCERALLPASTMNMHAGDPATVLRAIGQRMIAMMLSEIGLIIYRMVIADAAKFPDLARGFFEAGPVRAIGYLANWLTEETRQGRLAVSDPEFAAEQFFTLCQTHLVVRRRLCLASDPAQEEIDRVVEEAVTMFLSRYGV